jgi:hypothetical protein
MVKRLLRNTIQLVVSLRQANSADLLVWRNFLYGVEAALSEGAGLVEFLSGCVLDWNSSVVGRDVSSMTLLASLPLQRLHADEVATSTYIGSLHLNSILQRFYHV